MLILLFLAVTSACSAEQIAVSSILTYDVYGVYFNPRPTERQILWSSHACIIGYSLFMGAIATAFNYIGVSMGYLYELMGTMIGSAVVPIALCITWKKCNGTGAVVGAIVGFAAAIAGWIGITASLNGGVVNVDTTFGDYEMLTGNLLAIGVGGIITVVWSLIRPENFDWDITRAINAEISEPTNVTYEGSTPEITPASDEKVTGTEGGSKEGTENLSYSRSRTAEAQPAEMQAERDSLQKAFRFASWSAIALTIILIIVSRCPLQVGTELMKPCRNSSSHFLSSSRLMFTLLEVSLVGSLCLSSGYSLGSLWLVYIPCGKLEVVFTRCSAVSWPT